MFGALELLPGRCFQGRRCHIQKSEAVTIYNNILAPVNDFLIQVTITLNTDLISCLGEGCPEELYEVMCSCWSSHPDDRPTFAQLCDTLENVINDLNQNDVDYEQIYLTVSQLPFGSPFQQTILATCFNE